MALLIQDVGCQECPCSRVFPDASDISVCVSGVIHSCHPSLPSQETLAWALTKLLLLPLVLVCVRFCLHPLRLVAPFKIGCNYFRCNYFPQFCGASAIKPMLALKVKPSRPSPSQCLKPMAGSLTWGSKHSLL